MPAFQTVLAAVALLLLVAQEAREVTCFSPSSGHWLRTRLPHHYHCHHHSHHHPQSPHCRRNQHHSHHDHPRSRPPPTHLLVLLSYSLLIESCLALFLARVGRRIVHCRQ